MLHVLAAAGQDSQCQQSGLAMQIAINNGTVLVFKEVGDTRYSSESHFFYHLKKELAKITGTHCVKKQAHKDGNLVSEGVYYVRDAKRTWCVIDRAYALRDTAKTFNKEGQVSLSLISFIEGSQAV